MLANHGTAGFRGTKRRVWTFPSHSSPGKNYETILWANGDLTCNCRGWIYPKNGNPRTCTHVQRAENETRRATLYLQDKLKSRLEEVRKPPLGLKEVALRSREQAQSRQVQSNYDAIRNRKQIADIVEEVSTVSFPPVDLREDDRPFKKYRRLIRVAQ
jgi:hypothetical protein